MSIDGSSSTMACPRALYTAPYSLPFTTLLPLHIPPCESINCLLQTIAWITSDLLKLTSKKPELMVVVPKGKLWMVGDFIHPPSGWLPNLPFFSLMLSLSLKPTNGLSGMGPDPLELCPHGAQPGSSTGQHMFFKGATV